MKSLSLVAFLLLLIMGNSFANIDLRTNHKQVDKYEVDKSYANIVLPTKFAATILIDDEQLEQLNTYEVYQVDLVYTQFKRNESFDQDKLNETRVRELKELVPTIDADAPMWNYIEQTKAKDHVTAGKYFHGFVIHYRPKAVEYKVLKEEFKPFQIQEKTFKVKNDEPIQLTYTSGTRINVPAGAVTYKDGRPVEGSYEIIYNEFRNPAEIALSGIPMKYSKNGENLNFSSIGMYEIRGEKDGEELELQKPISIDFNCTETVDDAAFYQLDDATGEWEEIRPLDEEEFGQDVADDIDIELKDGGVAIVEDEDAEEVKKGELISIYMDSKNIGGMSIENRTFTKDTTCAVMNQKAWKSFMDKKNDAGIKKMVYRIDEEDKKVFIDPNDVDDFSSMVIGKKVMVVEEIQANQDGNAGIFINGGNRANGTLLGGGSFADPGHTYPDVVRGLNNSKFGVYNCDQIYRLAETSTIHPVYVDAATGRAIPEPKVACLMDLDFNGSFSFDPLYITYNPAGENALLVFTTSGKTYLILPEDFENIESSDQQPTLKMVDVTNKLKSSNDLKEMLNI